MILSFLAILNAKRDIIISAIIASPAQLVVENVFMIIINILVLAKNV
jgi:hypothetical protein